MGQLINGQTLRERLVYAAQQADRDLADLLREAVDEIDDLEGRLDVVAMHQPLPF